MIKYVLGLEYPIQALIATIFTWLITAIGALTVFLFKRVNKNLFDALLGTAAGIMVSAAFFSLLKPAIEMSEKINLTSWVVCTIGIFLGGVLLFIGDKIFDIFYKSKKNSSIKRSLMLILSITLHNIPEGLAVGVAFGSLYYGIDGATISSAYMLALGIGLQNFPEGMAVSLPLRREGFSRKKSFFYGQLSGIVEPISGLIGAILVIKVRLLLPYLLAFAAGAMIYVVVEELIPESQSNNKKDIMAFFTLIGFIIMMIMDLALG